MKFESASKLEFNEFSANPFIDSLIYNRLIEIKNEIISKKIDRTILDFLGANQYTYTRNKIIDYQKICLENGMLIMNFISEVQSYVDFENQSPLKSKESIKIGVTKKDSKVEIFLFSTPGNIILFKVQFEYSKKYLDLIVDVKFEKNIFTPLYKYSNEMILENISFNADSFVILKSESEISTFEKFKIGWNRKFKYLGDTKFLYKPVCKIENLPEGSWLNLPVEEELNKIIKEIRESNNSKTIYSYKLESISYLDNLKVKFVYSYYSRPHRNHGYTYLASGIFNLYDKTFNLANDDEQIDHDDYS